MSTVPLPGLLIAAPGSGAGKTTITLAIIRALHNNGVRVAAAKSGPDYIDPKFHEAASGKPSINLDAWAMTPDEIRGLAADQASDADILLIEAAMGLFDGSADDRGSAADLASILSVPVVLVIDCARQAQSVGALVAGFAGHRSDVEIAGLILNRVGSKRHAIMLRRALEPLGIPVLGIVARDKTLHLPERHLGLVQAQEHSALEAFLGNAAQIIEEALDLSSLQRLASRLHPSKSVTHLPPLAQHMAIARDDAFSFIYPHHLNGWKRSGATLSFFSPLKNEAPDPTCDAVFLPGGYPELHAGRLAAADVFATGIHKAAARGSLIYGECGGYMTLGQTLTDADNIEHPMLGHLPVSTSFAKRKLHLGYRHLTPHHTLPWTGILTGHEFHYATIVKQDEKDRLFFAEDATREKLSDIGHRRGNFMGSFAHVISRK